MRAHAEDPRTLTVLSVIGTRPEAIKMAPVIKEIGIHRGRGNHPWDGPRHALAPPQKVWHLNPSSARPNPQPLGLRANATYRLTRGIGWTLRTDQQVPIRSRTREWPSGSVNWVITPSQFLGRVLTNITAQVGYRRAESVNEQPTFGTPASVSLTSTVDKAFTPSVSVTWFRVVFTTVNLSRTSTDRVAAGNLFRNVRNGQNSTVTFSFRPPHLGRWRSNIRTTAGYSVADNTTCLRRAGQAECVPYVDSRQSQAQLTMDTDLPNNMGAGLQMAYVLNEERQTNRKVSQFVITAFVQLSTSVGQIR